LIESEPADDFHDEDSCDGTDSSEFSLLSQSEDEYQLRLQKDFISQAAHDLNTPLQSFCLSMELLRTSTLTNEQCDIISEASVAVDLMKGIVTRAIDAQRLAVGFPLKSETNQPDCESKHPVVRNEPTGRSVDSSQPAVSVSTRSSSEERLYEQIQAANLVAMLIEDTPSIRKLLQRTLLQIGLSKVLCYEDGKQGLEAMLTQPVDVVFSDVQMPIMSGDTMVRAFRQQVAIMLENKLRLQKQLIVAVTANGSEFMDLQGAGFDSVYPKPLSKTTLTSVVVDYLENKRHSLFV